MRKGFFAENKKIWGRRESQILSFGAFPKRVI